MLSKPTEPNIDWHRGNCGRANVCGQQHANLVVDARAIVVESLRETRKCLHHWLELLGTAAKLILPAVLSLAVEIVETNLMRFLDKS